MINSQVPYNKLMTLSRRLMLAEPEHERLRQNVIHALGELKGYTAAFDHSGLLRLMDLMEARESFELDGHIVPLLRLLEADASENHLDNDLCVRIIQLVHDHEALAVNSCSSLFPSTFFRRQTDGFRTKNEVQIRSYFTNLTLYTPPSGPSNINAYRRDIDMQIRKAGKGLELSTLAALHYQIRAVSPFSDFNGVAARLCTQSLMNQAAWVREWVFLSKAIAGDKEHYQSLMRDAMGEGNLSGFTSFVLEKILEGAQLKLNLMKRLRARMIRTRTIIDKYTEYNLPPELNELIYESVFIKTADIVGLLNCHRQTAYTYLQHLVNAGLLIEKKSGREKLYFHRELFDLLSN